jgi:outer membrane protein
MPTRIFVRTRTLILMAGLLACPLMAQQPKLTLQQAVAAALEHNPALKLAAAEMAVSEAAFCLAKTPLLPKIQFSENLTGGDDPVYAFGSKLRQQVFQTSDFSLDSLNRRRGLV